MQRKHKMSLIVTVFLSVLAFQILARFRGERDFEALVRQQRPVYAGRALHYDDGGSIEYRGFGYNLWSLHRMEPSISHGAMMPYRVGPRLRYWLPLPLLMPHKDAAIVT